MAIVGEQEAGRDGRQQDRPEAALVRSSRQREPSHAAEKHGEWRECTGQASSHQEERGAFETRLHGAIVPAMSDRDDSFELYDLRVEVTGTSRPMVCSHRVGDSFVLSGENLTFPAGQSFSIYALAALLPLLPAKQRPTSANDWMTTDTEIACPDPNCGGRFRITRTGTRTFRHRDVTVVPLPPP